MTFSFQLPVSATLLTIPLLLFLYLLVPLSAPLSMSCPFRCPSHPCFSFSVSVSLHFHIPQSLPNCSEIAITVNMQLWWNYSHSKIYNYSKITIMAKLKSQKNYNYSKITITVKLQLWWYYSSETTTTVKLQLQWNYNYSEITIAQKYRKYKKYRHLLSPAELGAARVVAFDRVVERKFSPGHT